MRRFWAASFVFFVFFSFHFLAIDSTDASVSTDGGPRPAFFEKEPSTLDAEYRTYDLNVERRSFYRTDQEYPPFSDLHPSIAVPSAHVISDARVPAGVSGARHVHSGHFGSSGRRSVDPPFTNHLEIDVNFRRNPPESIGGNSSSSSSSSSLGTGGGIAVREASYPPRWKGADDSSGSGSIRCHPFCFCEFPDQATCVGPRITTVPNRLNPALTVLEIVDASLLSIRTDSFNPYPHLQHLSLINCSVVKLEAFAFRGLSGLKTFHFNLNPLTHLSRYSFSGIFNCRLLNLTQNRIKRIHSLAFESSSYIEELHLQRNPLVHISARSFLGLSHVDSFVISELSNPTPVTTLEPDAFWGLREVKDLYLDGIPATRLTPFSFRGLNKVDHLYLRGTHVAVLEPHAFSGLVNVAYLHMDESKIKSIQATAFSDMINVSYVDLSKNQLYELSPESFDGIDAVVEHLDLMENPWHCNCSIDWMRKTANRLDDVTTLTRSLMSLRCHTPPEMRGRYLAQLDDRVMRCPTVAVERRVRQGEDPVATTSAAASGASGLVSAVLAPTLIVSWILTRFPWSPTSLTLFVWSLSFSLSSLSSSSKSFSSPSRPLPLRSSPLSSLQGLGRGSLSSLWRYCFSSAISFPQSNFLSYSEIPSPSFEPINDYQCVFSTYRSRSNFSILCSRFFVAILLVAIFYSRVSSFYD